MLTAPSLPLLKDLLELLQETIAAYAPEDPRLARDQVHERELVAYIKAREASPC